MLKMSLYYSPDYKKFALIYHYEIIIYFKTYLDIKNGLEVSCFCWYLEACIKSFSFSYSIIFIFHCVFFLPIFLSKYYHVLFIMPSSLYPPNQPSE